MILYFVSPFQILDCKSKVYVASRVNACDCDNPIIAHNYAYSSMIALSIIHSLILMSILYKLWKLLTSSGEVSSNFHKSHQLVNTY